MKEIYIIIWTGILLLSHASAQTTAGLFQKIYGNSDENRPTVIKAFNNGLYVAGYREVGGDEFATFSKFNLLTGALAWEKKFEISSRIADFEYEPSTDELILVGYTAPSGLVDNTSFWTKINGASGNPVSFLQFQHDGREGFHRILRHPVSNRYYVSGRKNPIPAPSTFDVVLLCEFDMNGAILWEKEFDNISSGDNEFFHGLYAYGNDLVMSGPTLNNDGVLVHIDPNGNILNNVSYPSFLLLSDGYDIGQGFMVLVGEDLTNNQAVAYVVNPALATTICATSGLVFHHIKRFKDIWRDQYGKFYVIGENKNLALAMNHQVVHKLDLFIHAGVGCLSVDWARYLKDCYVPESLYSNGTIYVSPPHDRIFYADARQRTPSSFGSWDMLIGSYDLNLGAPNCCVVDFPISTASSTLTPLAGGVSNITINPPVPTTPPVITSIMMGCDSFCYQPPPDCDINWVPTTCHLGQLNGSAASSIPGNYTFIWDIGCDGPANNIVQVVPTNTTSLVNPFPCGGGTFLVGLTIQDPFGQIFCNLCDTIVVTDTCCGVTTNFFSACTDTAYVYYYQFDVMNPPYASTCNAPVMTNNTPGSTLLSMQIVPITNGWRVSGHIQLSNIIPTTINFHIQRTCTCPSGAPLYCDQDVSIPTVCCKKIQVDDQVVCKDTPSIDIPLLVSAWPPLNNISRVTWYVQPKVNGVCPTTPFGITPYQDQPANSLTPLHLYPKSFAGDVCVYAVVHLDDGPCKTITSNIACISFCEPITCTLPEYSYCYIPGNPVVPGVITPAYQVPVNNCFATYTWLDTNGNPVSQSAGPFQPVAGISMTNPNDCYEDFYYTLQIVDFCGTRTCQSKVRLYSDNASIGALQIDPAETLPICKGEDLTFTFIPHCAGNPPQWQWYTRDCATGSNNVLINTAGTSNGVYNTNAMTETTWFGVQAANGVCLPKSEEILVEVLEPTVVFSFNAVSDPCRDLYVNLSATFSTCTIEGCPAPCSCNYFVDWYKDGNLIGTSSGSGAAIFTYTTHPLAGNYWAIVRNSCCPKDIAASQVVAIEPGCEPVITGPCFICDNVPETLCASMVIPPCFQCPDNCSFQWTVPSGSTGHIVGPDNIPCITVDAPGQYIVTSTCQDALNNICVKTDVFYLPGCTSNPCQMFCCTDSTAFFMQAQNAVTITYDPSDCTATLLVSEDFSMCGQIQEINWGDGSAISPDILMAGGSLTHLYADNQTVTISYIAAEENESTGLTCYQRAFSQELQTVCNSPCSCGTPPFSNLMLSSAQGPSYNIGSCNSGVPIIACADYTLSGTLPCIGCGLPNSMEWDLIRPDGSVISATSSIPTNPAFSFLLPSSYFNTSGLYQMVLKGHCGSNFCKCSLFLEVSLDCPCDTAQFTSDVSKGFTTTQPLYSCKMCFTPKKLLPCDIVEWSFSNVLPSPVAITSGNQTFCYTFPSSGTYTITMKVFRKKSAFCFCDTLRTYTRTVNVQCGILPNNCINTKTYNPGFSDMSASGVMGSGGSSEHWKEAHGTPRVDSIEGGQGDGWAITLSGNADAFDAIRTLNQTCLEKENGMIRFLLRRLGGDIAAKPGERLVIHFVRGSSYIPQDCSPPNCYEIANLALPDSLADWAYLETDYQLDMVQEEDFCDGAAPYVLITPVIRVQNDMTGDQSVSQLQLDQFCLEGEGYVGSKDLATAPVGLRLFPNPTEGWFTLESYLPIAPETHFKVISLTGQEVMSIPANTDSHRQTFDGRQLAAGVYAFVTYRNGNIAEILKLVKL